MAFTGTLEQCLRRIPELFNSYYMALLEEVYKEASTTIVEVEREAKMNAPRGESGALKASYTHEVKAEDGAIVAKCGVPNDSPAGEYAAFSEFGTGKRGAASNVEVPENYHHPKYHEYNMDWPGMSAQPTLLPAFRIKTKNFSERIANAHRRAAKRAKVGG